MPMPALPPITPGLVYQITVSVFAGYSLVNAIADWFTFRKPKRPPASPVINAEGEPLYKGLPASPAVVGVIEKTGPGQLTEEEWNHPFPSLSVLIPARNEEAVIGGCLQTLLKGGYPGALEILVLDDNSTDKTAEVVGSIAARDSRVRLISGGPLLPGWKGKPNALRQLAQHATGEMLLLTDADCLFNGGALGASVRHWEKVGADCLSLMPRLDSESFWEHVVIPLQVFLVFATLPVRNIYASPNPAFAAANGAFLLLPASLYRELGGHEAVRGEMAEDIKFAQHVKRRGYRMVYGDGSDTYSVRMYTSFREIWDGFSKNLYPAMGKSLPVLIVWSLFLVTTQILPFVFVARALVVGDRTLAGFALPLLHVLIALGIRLALAVRFRHNLLATLTHPLGWIVTVAIAFNSAYLTYSRRGHSWKGRVYAE